MKVFVEGYDVGNMGDQMMAAVCCRLAGEFDGVSKVLLPRPLTPDLMRELPPVVVAGERKQRRWFRLRAKNRPSRELSGNLEWAQAGDIVLYCNGFVFGDTWSEEWIRRIIIGMEKYNQIGVKIILMPASFGPFAKEGHAILARRLLDSAQLILARDDAAYAALANITQNYEKISRSLEYTGLLNEISGLDEGGRDNIAYIIPSEKIGQKLGLGMEELYLSFLAAAAVRISERTGASVRVLQHTFRKDQNVARRLALRASLDLVPAMMTLETRKLIGRGRFVVTSRFHGFMNALSQGCPAISLGWAEKYQNLARDFCIEWAATDFREGGGGFEAVDRMIEQEGLIRTILAKVNQDRLGSYEVFSEYLRRKI